LYVDEFQNFATESFTNILSEARKYRLNITLGHQYIGQLSVDNSTKMRDAVFGNVGTLVVFRVGAEDAEFLEREFTPQFTAEDLVNLPKYNVYLKLMIDGISGHPFSAETLPPPIPLENSNREKIIKASRERYGIKREIVEEKISRWSGFGKEEESLPVAPMRAGQTGKKDNLVNFRPQNQQSQPRPAPQGGETKLYDAICSNCGKPTKVIFPPEKGRAVYCKSCLKKMKAGEAVKTQTQAQVSEKTDFFGPVARNFSGAEFPDLEEVKIENVPFHNPKKNQEDKKFFNAGQDRPKRKEINLSELRKALEASLEKEEKPREEEIEDISEPKKVDEKPAKPQNELQERIEGEKEMDEAQSLLAKAGEPEKKSEQKVLPPPKKGADKKIIKPGETIKF
jgi:CxxC-x17-CxxC domain-containing protein